MKIAVLTVNYYSGKFTELLVRSIFQKNTDDDITVCIFDNGSSDKSLTFIENGQFNTFIIRKHNHYELGSRSHGFAMDSLFRSVDLSAYDVVCLIDSDCFSFKNQWLSEYCNHLKDNNLSILAAPAYCPIIEEEFKYCWPGFTILAPDAVEFIKSNSISFIPMHGYKKSNDSGQVVSDKLIEAGFAHEYLPRTDAMMVGNLQMSRWSIDNTVHHFFAASTSRAVRNPFNHIYNVKGGGRYINKLMQARKLFKQPQVKQLMEA